MEQVNALRAILVAAAVVAALICAAFGIWSAAIVLAAGVGAHALLWRYLHRLDREPAEQQPGA
jgi:membrane protein implicated in regulation of membrane protease activity